MVKIHGKVVGIRTGLIERASCRMQINEHSCEDYLALLANISEVGCISVYGLHAWLTKA